MRERVVGMLAQIDQRIEAVTAASEALAPILQPDQRPQVPTAAMDQTEREFEITATVREILKSAYGWLEGKYFHMEKLAAPEIRDRLVLKGWKAEDYDNPLAVVHTVLKRLVKSGEVECERDAEQKLRYKGVLSALEMEAITAAHEQARAETDKAYRERVERDRIISAKRRSAGKAIIKACRELFCDGVVMSIDEARESMVQRGIDLSCYATPRSGIIFAFKQLGIKKRNNGLWSYDVAENTAESRRSESAKR